MTAERKLFEEGAFLDRTRNQAAFETLNLLNIIASAGGKGLSDAEIIQMRNGGVYPSRTSEELQLLQEYGHVLVQGDGDVTRHTVSDVGVMELALQGSQRPQDVEATLKATKEELETNPPDLPVERYGNEEFRFTWDSVVDLLHRIIINNSYVSPKVMALGVPTVCYAGALTEGLVETYLMDINESIVRDLNNREIGPRAVKYSALHEIPPSFRRKFDAVVIDPPWHNEHYSLFADRAYELLRPYGRLYIATPAPATRKEASKELNEMYANLIRGGLDLIEIKPEFFGYTIPEYEQRLFAAQGINVTSRGKYGQLVVTQAIPERSDTCSTPESIEKVVQSHCENIEVGGEYFGGIYAPQDVLEAEDLDEEQAPFHVLQFGDGVYETTSRSTRREQGVNFITTDHIAYIVSDPKKLKQLFDILNSQVTKEIDEDFIKAVVNRFNIPESEATSIAVQFSKIITPERDIEPSLFQS